MELIKFCNPEHNIKRGAMLRIGTLYSYRNIENATLRDEHEGTYKFLIEFPEEVELDTRWCNLLLQGAIRFGDSVGVPRFPGSFSTEIKSLHVVKQTDKSVFVKDTSILITRSVSNSLIFCMSLLENGENSPFPEYTDYWNLPFNMAGEFCQKLGNLIFQQAKLSLFENTLTTNHSPASVRALNIYAKHQPIIYRDRTLQITKINMPTYEELVELLINIQFTKPSKYSNEKEYRFSYELNDGNQVFVPTVESMLLNLNSLI